MTAKKWARETKPKGSYMEASSLTLFYLVTFFSLMEDVTTEILSELFLNIFFLVGQFIFCIYFIALQSWHIGTPLMKNKNPFQK